MKRYWSVALGMLLAFPLQAQEAPKTEVTYDLTAETAVGTGDFTAFHLTSNRYHTLATRPNTGYLRGAVKAEHPLKVEELMAFTFSGIVICLIFEQPLNASI